MYIHFFPIRDRLHSKIVNHFNRISDAHSFTLRASITLKRFLGSARVMSGREGVASKRQIGRSGDRETTRKLARRSPFFWVSVRNYTRVRAEI